MFESLNLLSDLKEIKSKRVIIFMLRDNELAQLHNCSEDFLKCKLLQLLIC